VRDSLPACLAQNTDLNVCTAAVTRDSVNWECFEPFAAFVLGTCAAEFEALNTSLSQ